VLDVLLGRADEVMISHLIAHWRETVWRNAQRLIDAEAQDERRWVLTDVEAEALRLGHLIGAGG
jgi:hypothetical protein